MADEQIRGETPTVRHVGSRRADEVQEQLSREAQEFASAIEGYCKALGLNGYPSAERLYGPIRAVLASR
jgi:hypothetical protein